VSTYAFGVRPFYDSLAHLGLFEGAGAWERRKILARVRANQKKLRRYARFAPMNYQHKLVLVEAETRRVERRPTRTTELYLQAIAQAKEHDFILDEALASELAARYFLKSKKMETGKRLMMDARYAYLRWGAMAKVAEIDAKYGYLRGAVYGNTS